ncbi:MAG: ABC transporter substrate-binding protein, partial [Dehalococcoidia bacterium]|nr:ABC transporter substrate-binding protein [Dehalococcoidia bacterium]
IYSKPEIKSIADLKGKAIAVPSIGSALDITAGAVLKKHGLDPKSDVAWVATGPGAAWTGALKAGSVDAGVYSALGALDLKEAGFKELVDLGKEIPNVQGGLTTTEKLIKERPDLIKKMVTAMVKARKYYAAQSPAAREYYAKYANLDPTKAKQLYDLEALAETNNGLADDASLKFTVQFEQEQAGIKGDFPVENMYNMSFAKDANRELDAAGWKPQ